MSQLPFVPGSCGLIRSAQGSIVATLVNGDGHIGGPVRFSAWSYPVPCSRLSLFSGAHCFGGLDGRAAISGNKFVGIKWRVNKGIEFGKRSRWREEQESRHWHPKRSLSEERAS